MMVTVKRVPLVALASLALVVPIAGCGGGSHAADSGTTATASSVSGSAPTTSATAPTTTTTPTSSSSSSTQAPPNPATYGQPASASQRAAVSRVVRGYYAALSSGRQAAACKMLTAHIQQLLERSIRRTSLLHGKGCVGAFKLIFGRGGRTSSISPTISVTGVRIQGDKGYALFSTQSLPSAQIRVQRERGAWKIASLIGSPLAGSAASSGG